MRQLLLIAGTVLLGAALLAWGLSALSPQQAPATTPSAASGGQSASLIVMLSGRDDHGLLQLEQVPLQRAIDDQTPTAYLPDGSFLRVLEQHGEWMHVVALHDPAQRGWVNDFYLRGMAAYGGQQVRFVDARQTEHGLELAVRPVTQQDAAPIWVLASELREIGAREEEPGHDHHHRPSP